MVDFVYLVAKKRSRRANLEPNTVGKDVRQLRGTEHPCTLLRSPSSDSKLIHGGYPNSHTQMLRAVVEYLWMRMVSN